MAIHSYEIHNRPNSTLLLFADQVLFYNSGSVLGQIFCIKRSHCSCAASRRILVMSGNRCSLEPNQVEHPEKRNTNQGDVSAFPRNSIIAKPRKLNQVTNCALYTMVWYNFTTMGFGNSIIHPLGSATMYEFAVRITSSPFCKLFLPFARNESTFPTCPPRCVVVALRGNIKRPNCFLMEKGGHVCLPHTITRHEHYLTLPT